ncbi:glycosyltransferase [Methylobacterium nigriterrae]|uniref:glycosyltransferase n=1 Tax=Methylobacterium nigriterrae TaxID=3127512 RepID=UPI0030136FC3
MSDLLIIIPLYRGVELIAELFANLGDMAEEINELNAEVLLVNDSPDDPELAAALLPAMQALGNRVEARLLVNPRNLGFIQTANRGLERARESGSDALLLNSDALLTRGSLRELRAVSRSDPLIAVVSPRSNNATICNSPYDRRFRAYDRADALAAHQRILKHLPRTTYVPTAVGFCLYIRGIVLQEFGLLDEVYGAGYNEENDFIMRCGRRGYRAVMANRAFVHHLGSVSFEQSGEGRSPREKKNREILDERYPEYAPAIERYFEGTEYLSQLLCSGLIPDRDGKISVHFDCMHIGAYHNGTFEHAKKLLAAFAERFGDKYHLYVSCEPDALAFHELSRIPGVTYRVEEEPEASPYGVTIRLAQPFNWRDLVDVSCSAPVSGFLMLDTIAMDCPSLDEHGLESMWRQMLNMVSFIGFNSRFTRDQFARRFAIPETVTEFISLCSTTIIDYRPQRANPVRRQDAKRILVVGNHFAHKNVRTAVELLKSAVRGHRIVVLGVDFPDDAGIDSFKSGSLTQEDVDQLYDSASVVLFPSYYEGFGLPIMHALARNLPVVARDLPVFEEIRDRSEYGHNVHLRASTQDLVDLAVSDLPWAAAREPVARVQSWEQAAEDLDAGIAQAIARFDGRDLRRRMESAELARNWFAAMDHADAVWLGGGERTPRARRARTLPVQPARKASLRARWASYARHNDVVWSAKQALERLALTRSRRAEALLPAIDLPSEGGDLELTSPHAGKHPAGSFRVVYARNFLDSFSIREIGIRLLDIGDSLLIGGVLYFELRKARRKQNLPVNVDTHEGVRILCANAGFRVAAIETRGSRTVVAAIKVQPWLDIALDEGDDQNFVRSLYRSAFRRNVDDDARIYVDELAKGATRLDLARKLFTSAERISVLLRPTGRARFN